MSKINQNWVFGIKCGLDFSANNTNRPLPVPSNLTGQGVKTEGCASVSDNNGNLLFYTNGRRIWDGSGTMITGPNAKLKGHYSSTQSSIIVPVPGNESEYYIFTMDGRTDNPGPHNNLNGVRLNAQNIQSSITPIENYMLSPSNVLPDTTGLAPAEKLTAVQHKNCKDFWVLTVLQKGTIAPTNRKGVLRILLVDHQGITHERDIDLDINITFFGCIRISPDAKWFAVARESHVTVYPFDNSNGTIDINNSIDIKIGGNSLYGLEFSPNSQYLYCSVYVGNLFRIDLTNPTPSKNLIYTFTQNVGGDGVINALQLGIDNVIYIAKPGDTSLAAIIDPDSPSPTIDEKYIQLSNVCGRGLPNLIPNLCEDSGGDCDCSCCSCCNCNKDAKTQNEELIELAQQKEKVIKSNEKCLDPFLEECTLQVIEKPEELEPCFYMHYDGKDNKLSTRRTYITVSNKFTDIQYNGLQITKITLIPEDASLDKIYILPDRLIFLDCLTPCSSKTREFALVNEYEKSIQYKLEVEYCYESIILKSAKGGGKVEFKTK